MASFVPTDIAGILGIANSLVANQAPLTTSEDLIAALTQQRQGALTNQLSGIDTQLQAALGGILAGGQQAQGNLIATADRQAPDFAAILGQYAQGNPIAPTVGEQAAYNNALAAFGGDPAATGISQFNSLAQGVEAAGGGLLAQTAQGADSIIRDILVNSLSGITAAGQANANNSALQARVAAQKSADDQLFQLAAQLQEGDLRAQQSREANLFGQQMQAFQALLGQSNADRSAQLDVDQFNQQAQNTSFNQNLAVADYNNKLGQQATDNAYRQQSFAADESYRQQTLDQTKTEFQYRKSSDERSYNLAVADLVAKEQQRIASEKSSAESQIAKDKAAATKAYQDNLKSTFSQTLAKAGVNPVDFWNMDAAGQSKVMDGIIKSGAFTASKGGVTQTNDQIKRSAGMEVAATSINTQAEVIINSGGYDRGNKSWQQKYDGNNTEALIAYAGFARAKNPGLIPETEADTTKTLRAMASKVPELKAIKDKTKRAQATSRWMKESEQKVRVYAGEGYLDNGRFVPFTAEEKKQLKERTK
jgi:hypothetical protein